LTAISASSFEFSYQKAVPGGRLLKVVAPSSTRSAGASLAPAGSLATLVSPPDPASRLWYDTRDIPFLREDQKDQSEILALEATAIRTLVVSGRLQRLEDARHIQSGPALLEK